MIYHYLILYYFISILIRHTRARARKTKKLTLKTSRGAGHTGDGYVKLIQGGGLDMCCAGYTLSKILRCVYTQRERAGCHACIACIANAEH